MRTKFLEWIESNDDGGHLAGENRGRRVFRYDAAADAVSMDYFGPDGTLETVTWPWNDAFYALYEWDMMC